MLAESGDGPELAGTEGEDEPLDGVWFIVIGCIGFGAGAVVFTVGFVSSVSHQSQIAIAATMRTMTTMSGQFSFPKENAVEACAD